MAGATERLDPTVANFEHQHGLVGRYCHHLWAPQESGTLPGPETSVAQGAESDGPGWALRSRICSFPGTSRHPHDVAPAVHGH